MDVQEKLRNIYPKWKVHIFKLIYEVAFFFLLNFELRGIQHVFWVYGFLGKVLQLLKMMLKHISELVMTTGWNGAVRSQIL